jgi:hypothetical protein
MSARPSTSRSAISNGSRLLDGVDGRSATARRFRDLCLAYEQEISSGETLTEIERGTARQAAALAIRSEQLQRDIVNGKDIDPDHLTRISGSIKRLLDMVKAKGAKRKTTEPVADLAAYLASKSSGGAP